MARTIVSGGGYDSRQHVKTTKGKQEPISHKGNPAGVAQQGVSTAFPKEPITSGRGYQPYGPKNHTMQGPGAGRQISKSGSQGLYSSSGKKMPMPSELMPAGRDFLIERPNKGNRP
jgi:hypothetical protein